MRGSIVQQTEIERTIDLFENHQKFLQRTFTSGLLLMTASSKDAANASSVQSDQSGTRFQIVGSNVQTACDAARLNEMEKLSETHVTCQDDLAPEQIFFESDVANEAPLVAFETAWISKYFGFSKSSYLLPFLSNTKSIQHLCVPSFLYRPLSTPSFVAKGGFQPPPRMPQPLRVPASCQHINL